MAFSIDHHSPWGIKKSSSHSIFTRKCLPEAVNGQHAMKVISKKMYKLNKQMNVQYVLV